jgi:hypothetical protein
MRRPRTRLGAPERVIAKREDEGGGTNCCVRLPLSQAVEQISQPPPDEGDRIDQKPRRSSRSQRIPACEIVMQEVSICVVSKKFIIF